MAYVPGDLGKKIENLMDNSNNEYNKGNYDKAIDLLINAWELLPDDKNQWEESYLIIWRILDVSIRKTGKIDIMNQWVNNIFYADPGRRDTGEREMWAGRVAYESGAKDQALEYFKTANKKSRGRCFWDSDGKYREFLIENMKKSV